MIYRYSPQSAALLEGFHTALHDSIKVINLIFFTIIASEAHLLLGVFAFMMYGSLTLYLMSEGSSTRAPQQSRLMYAPRFF